MAFNGRFVLNLARLAQNQGLDLLQAIQCTGASVEELSKEDFILDDRQFNRFVESVIEETGDDLFGLHAGQQLNMAAAGFILQLVQSCGTVKQAYELCCEYANLGCSALPMELIETNDFFKVVFTPNSVWKADSELSFQQTALGIICFKIREFHSLTLLKRYPLKVTLPWDRPNRFSEIQECFGCNVEFGGDELSIYFQKDDMNAEIVSSNYGLLQLLVKHADEINSIKESKKDFKGLVEQTVVQLLKPEFPNVDQVASQLNVSSRTLQRRLSGEGVTFKAIIEGLRKEFAIRYLKRNELSISEVADLLSYSEVSAFSRSFKKWVGVSPSEYRIGV